MSRVLIHDRLGLSPANYTLLNIDTQDWGSRIVVTCRYSYPPQTVLLTLIFDDVRSTTWYVQGRNADMRDEAQLLTHDLGLGNYERTARFASTLAEVIISYDKLKIVRE